MTERAKVFWKELGRKVQEGTVIVIALVSQMGFVLF